MGPEIEPGELDPMMTWLQEEEGQPVLLDEPLAPIARSRTRPPRQLRSRAIVGTVSWQPDVEQYVFSEESKPKQWKECTKTLPKDRRASSSLYPSTQLHRDLMKSSYWQLLYDPTLDRVNRRSKVEKEAVAMQINSGLNQSQYDCMSSMFLDHSLEGSDSEKMFSVISHDLTKEMDRVEGQYQTIEQHCGLGEGPVRINHILHKIGQMGKREAKRV